jgi:serine/threonine-protein kinase
MRMVSPVESTPFGRYRLIELLGRGGMGEVWRAHDTVTDRDVAVKVLPTNLSEDEDFQRRFRREAHAAARLDTPHVVPIYDYGEIDDRLFVSMRLIKGRDLDTVLADGPLDPARAVRIVGQVAEALHAAHEIVLIHRDIKPSNILLDDRDFAYLIDFGIARVADETRMTKAGNTIGTFAYIAPERLDPHTQEDARADIYSLACVLYEALTGKPPFAGSTTAHLIAAHLNTPPPQPSTTKPDVPRQVDEVIARGMAKDRDQRYATTIEFANAARDAITVPIQRATPSPAPHPPIAPAQSADSTMPENLIPPVSAPAFVDQTSAATAASQPSIQPSRSDPAVHAGPPRTVGQDADGVGEHPTRLAANKPTPAQLTPQPPSLPPVGGAGQPPAPPSRLPQQPVPPRRYRSRWIIAGVAAVVILVAGAVGIPAILRHRTSEAAPTSHTVPTSAQTVPTSAKSNSSQVALPFTGLKGPWGVAVDSAGDVYVADFFNKRVLKQAAGSSTEQSLPFTDLMSPAGVAVDSAGNVYVADGWSNQVVKLSAASSTQEVLPFTGFAQPVGVAVDSAGNVYVADSNNSRVLKLPAGSSTQQVLPFAGLNLPEGIAVDLAGNVYVADTRSSRAVKLPAGSSTQEVLPFTGLTDPAGIAVDSAGNVYVADRQTNRVLELAGRSTSQRVLSFNGLELPRGVAVDNAGNVYVTDHGNNRVLKLPVQ